VEPADFTAPGQPTNTIHGCDESPAQVLREQCF